MSYTKGEAFIGEDWDRDNGNRLAAQLPHSCDEWVIGGPKEIDDLIADLTELKKKLTPQEPTAWDF